MFNRDKAAPVARPAGGRLAATALWCTLLFPFVAVAGLTAGGPREGSTIAAADDTRPAPGQYQIRCWQEGRLLFEQNRVRLPDSGRYGIRLSGTDRNNRPIYVAETQNATCLIRAAVQEREYPR